MSVVLCSDEIRPLVEKLIETYPTNLAEVDPSRLLYVRSNGKRRPVGLSAVRSPWDLCTKFKFVLTVHGPKWDKLDEDRQAIALFDELIRIKDFETSSLSTHSVIASRETIETWGVDWMEAESVAPVFSKEQEQKKA